MGRAADRFEHFAFNHYRDALDILMSDTPDMKYALKLIGTGDGHVKRAVELRLQDD